VHENDAFPLGGNRRSCPLTLGGIGINKYQGRSLRGEQLRTSRADAASRARDQPGPAAEPPIRRHHRAALSRLISVTSQRRRMTGSPAGMDVAYGA
jgi:hypothetical protein